MTPCDHLVKAVVTRGRLSRMRPKPRPQPEPCPSHLVPGLSHGQDTAIPLHSANLLLRRGCGDHVGPGQRLLQDKPKASTISTLGLPLLAGPGIRSVPGQLPLPGLDVSSLLTHCL